MSKKSNILIAVLLLSAAATYANCGACGGHAEEAKKKAACASEKVECAAEKAACAADQAECAKKAGCEMKKECCGTCQGDAEKCTGGGKGKCGKEKECGKSCEGGKKWYNPISWFK
jgi:hypothetical protein